MPHSLRAIGRAAWQLGATKFFLLTTADYNMASAQTSSTAGHRTVLASTADGWYDRDLTSGCDRSRKSTRISSVFLPDKNVDVFPHLSLLRCDTISDSWIDCPECGQGVGQRCSWVFDLDPTASGGKFPQGSRNVKNDRHGVTCSSGAFCSLCALWCDVLAQP